MAQNIGKDMREPNEPATNIEIVGVVLQSARNMFDQFNLDVAKFRVEKGMSADLAKLYSLMGSLDRNIVGLINDTERIAALYQHLNPGTKIDNTSEISSSDLIVNDTDSEYSTGTYIYTPR